jgi:hypothetical protein
VPRELNGRPAITIRIAEDEFSRHHDEAPTAEFKELAAQLKDEAHSAPRGPAGR